MFLFKRKQEIDPNSPQEINRKRDLACKVIQDAFKFERTIISMLNDIELVDKLVNVLKENTTDSLNSAIRRLGLKETPDNRTKAAFAANQIKQIYQ